MTLGFNRRHYLPSLRVRLFATVIYIQASYTKQQASNNKQLNKLLK
jgi:hypothetical protein